MSPNDTPPLKREASVLGVSQLKRGELFPVFLLECLLIMSLKEYLGSTEKISLNFSWFHTSENNVLFFPISSYSMSFLYLMPLSLLS